MADATNPSVVTEERKLPEGCGYQGYEFGASYPDSQCFGGRLYDMDNCDSNGLIYEPGEEIPCPICHPRLSERYWTERNHLSGASYLKARHAAKLLVANIRRNRKNGTEPWKGNAHAG
jgi:hypothetical protein